MSFINEKTYTYDEIFDAVSELIKHIEMVDGRDYALGYIKSLYCDAITWPMTYDQAFLMRHLDHWREEARKVKTVWDTMAEEYEKYGDL